MESLILIKSLTIIAAVLAALYFIVIMIKKQILYGTKNAEKKITIISYCRIDQKSSLTLLNVEGEKFLLASNGVGIVLKRIKNTL